MSKADYLKLNSIDLYDILFIYQNEFRWDFMKLKLCPKCKRPFLADKECCPHCPAPPTLNQESWATMGCLLLSIIPLFVMILFWLFFFIGFFIR